MKESMQAEIERMRASSLPWTAFGKSLQQVTSRVEEVVDEPTRDVLSDYMKNRVREAFSEGTGPQATQNEQAQAVAPVQSSRSRPKVKEAGTIKPGTRRNPRSK